MRVEHYPDTDAVYVHLSDAKVARTAGSTDGWAIDFAEDGSVVGVEFWGISEGIDLAGIPERVRVQQALQEAGIGARFLV